MMLNLKSLLAAAVYAVTLTSAQGTDSIGSISCGTKTYTKQQVDEAIAEGCRLSANNQQVGNNNYPHRFSNFEKLVFATSGPFQEFPIVSNGKYTGGSPGADRVVFNPNYQGQCVYVGSMTHTGASTNNGFVSCAERSSGRPGTDASSTSSATTSASRTSSPTSSATPSTTARTDSGSQRIVALGGQGLALGLMAWAFIL